MCIHFFFFFCSLELIQSNIICREMGVVQRNSLESIVFAIFYGKLHASWYFVDIRALRGRGHGFLGLSQVGALHFVFHFIHVIHGLPSKRFILKSGTGNSVLKVLKTVKMKSDPLNWFSENLHNHKKIEKLENSIFNEKDLLMQLCSFNT